MGSIHASLPTLQVHVKPGDVIEKGSVLMTVEGMKMEVVENKLRLAVSFLQLAMEAYLSLFSLLLLLSLLPSPHSHALPLPLPLPILQDPHSSC